MKEYTVGIRQKNGDIEIHRVMAADLTDARVATMNELGGCIATVLISERRKPFEITLKGVE